MISLAHSADVLLEAAPVADRRSEGEKQQVAPRDKSVRQAGLLEADRGIAGQRRVADLPEHAEIDQVILAKPLAPFREFAAQAFGDADAALHLDPMALAVIEADRLDPGESGEGPGQAGRRILPTG